MKSQSENILSPSHYSEIAKLPEEKQKEIIQQLYPVRQNFAYREAALLVFLNLKLVGLTNFRLCDFMKSAWLHGNTWHFLTV